MKEQLQRFISELTLLRQKADDLAVYSMDEMNDANRASYYARQARIYEDVIKRLLSIVIENKNENEHENGRVDA